MSCPFAAPGRQEACLSLQRQRTELMTREYDRNECYSCPMRRKRLEGAQEPERIAVPPAQFNQKTEPIIPKKETPVAEKMDPKERVFAVIQKFGACVSTPILQRVTTVNAEQLREIAQDLVKEGRIEIRQEGRKAIFAIPGTPAMSNGATVAAKPPRRVNRPSATPPSKTRAKSERPVPAPREPVVNNSFAAAIAGLEAQRAKIDTAIDALRALA